MRATPGGSCQPPTPIAAPTSFAPSEASSQIVSRACRFQSRNSSTVPGLGSASFVAATQRSSSSSWISRICTPVMVE